MAMLASVLSPCQYNRRHRFKACWWRITGGFAFYQAIYGAADYYRLSGIALTNHYESITASDDIFASHSVIISLFIFMSAY